MADQVIKLSTCPRCEFNSLEYLKTHVNCYNCNYSPDLDFVSNFEDYQVPPWAIEALNEMKAFEHKTSQRTPPGNPENKIEEQDFEEGAK
jgi:hypothetical protein